MVATKAWYSSAPKLIKEGFKKKIVRHTLVTKGNIFLESLWEQVLDRINWKRLFSENISTNLRKHVTNIKFILVPLTKTGNTSLAAKGALAYRLQRRTACKIQNGPKMTDGVWKGVYPLVFGRSKQILLNKFFDPSTPSMRKGRDGEKTGGKMGGKKEKENLDENSGHYVIASSQPS